jgi:hypothetical protein
MRKTLAACALAALVAVGCGSDAPSESGATTSAPKKSAGLKFAACMREHGVKQFPDPDASGRLTIDGVLNGSSIDADSPEFKRAIAACKDLRPPGFTGYKRSDKQQSAALVFAQCIRDNGVKDFPDPLKDQPLVDTNRIPSANREGGMAILNAAMKKCRAAGKKAIQERG